MKAKPKFKRGQAVAWRETGELTRVTGRCYEILEKKTGCWFYILEDEDCEHEGGLRRLTLREIGPRP